MKYVVFKNDGSYNPPGLIWNGEESDVVANFFGTEGPYGGLNDCRASCVTGPFETVEAAQDYIGKCADDRWDQSVTIA